MKNKIKNLSGIETTLFSKVKSKEIPRIHTYMVGCKLQFDVIFGKHEWSRHHPCVVTTQGVERVSLVN